MTQEKERSDSYYQVQAEIAQLKEEKGRLLEEQVSLSEK